MGEITATYAASQVFAMIAFIFLGAHYLVKTRQKIALTHQGAMVSNAISYGLLGGWSGVAMCVIAFGRNLYTLIDERRQDKNEYTKRQDKIFLIAIYTAIIIMAIVTYRGPGSLLPVMALLIQSFAIWQKEVRLCKFLLVIVSIFYLAYNVYIFSLVGMVMETILLVISIVGYMMVRRSSWF